MKSCTPLIDAIGSERATLIMRNLIQCRGQLEPPARQNLDKAVADFFAQAPLALDTLMSDKALLDTHPTELEILLKRALDRTTDDQRRARIEGYALDAGFPDLVTKPTAPKPPDQGFLTRSQRAGLDRLLGLARLHFEGRTMHGVAVRTSGLIVGPSGVGKSNLARQLSSRIEGGAFYFKSSYGEWAPTGARTEITTLQRLRLAVEKHDRIVCHLDELDKIQPGSSSDSWTRCLLTEVYGVLDRQLGETVGSRYGWTSELLERLRRNVLFVGSGTFQDLWRKQDRGGIGFGGTARSTDIAESINQARIIPDELRLRFSPTLIVLEPYTARDFEEIAAGLKLPPGVLDPTAAAESGGNWRAVEAAVTEHSLRQLGAGEF